MALRGLMMPYRNLGDVMSKPPGRRRLPFPTARCGPGCRGPLRLVLDCTFNAFDRLWSCSLSLFPHDMSFMLSSRDTTTPLPYIGSTQHATRLRNPIIKATSRRDTQGQRHDQGIVL